MVQVDVFWSYAIGAGFGAAAARTTPGSKKIPDPPRATPRPKVVIKTNKITTPISANLITCLTLYPQYRTRYRSSLINIAAGPGLEVVYYLCSRDRNLVFRL